jgi:O-antigen/teichoic acid export membrane protein
MAQPSRIASGVAASYANIGAGILCNLALIPLYVRHLGRGEYGLWIAVSGVVAYLGLLNLGITQTTANLCADAVSRGSSHRAIRILATGFWSYVRVAALALLALAVAGPLVPWHLFFKGSSDLRVTAAPVVIACAATFLVELPFSLFGACLRTLGRIERQQAVAIAQNVARLAVAFAFLSAGGTLIGLVVLLSAVNLLTGVGNLRLVGRELPGVTLAPAASDKLLRREMTGPSAYFLLLQASGAVAFGADTFIIAALLGTSEVAPYGIAQRLAFMAIGAVAAIGANFAPGFIVANARGDRGALRTLFARATAISVGLGTLIAGGLLLLGPAFIRLWVGPANFVGTTPFVAIVSLLFLQMVLSPADALLVATCNHRAYAVAGAWEAVLGITLAVVLGLHMGVAGVAIAKLAARIFGAGPVMVVQSYRLVAR